MTPNNIVNMAKIKELDLIAVCDHNSARNLPAVAAVAKEAGICLLPGIEITTAEEIHLLSYFPTVETAVAFGDYIYEALAPIENRPEIFGEQEILNEDDEVIGHMDKLLINACAYSIDQLVKEVRAVGGIPVPAHVNKEANAILTTLGYIPEDLAFTTIEVFAKGSLANVPLDRYRMIYSSDAHYLLDMAERENYLHVEEASAAAALKKLGQKQ